MFPSLDHNAPQVSSFLLTVSGMQVFYLLFIILLGTMTIPAFGDSVAIGVAVSGIGETTQVTCGGDLSTCVDPDGTIKVFIPLLPNGDPSDPNDLQPYPSVGTTQDTISTGTSGPGGYVDLFLYFDLNGDSYSNATLTLTTTDLDFIGVNDPNRSDLSILEGLVFLHPRR